MSLLPIVKIGRPVLREKTKPFSAAEIAAPAAQQLVKDMIETMRKADGVGLAANQVGRDLSLCTLECPEHSPRYPQAADFALEVWFNPRIVEFSKETETDWEGCLSIPGYRGLVPRARWVVFDALTPEGKSVRRRLEGFHARVLQHETDHLNGFFYVDRMPDLKTWTHLEEMQP